MKTYILSNGKPIDVPEEKEEEFLEQLEKQNLTATQKSDELGKSQGASQPQINQQVNTESTSVDGSSESKLPENFIEPSQEEWDNITKNTWFKKEENLVKWLNDGAYRNTGVKFEEAKAGKDAIEVLIGNQKAGQGKVFNVNSSNVFDTMKHYIKESTDKDYENEMLSFLSNNISESDALLDAGEQERAQFANNLDKATNQTYYKPDPNNVFEPDNRLRVSESSFFAPTYEADMEGSVTLPNGKKLSYEYIFDNYRSKLSDLYKQQSKKNDKEFEEKKRLKEGRGKTGKEALVNYSKDVVTPYFNLLDSGRDDIAIASLEGIETDIANITETIDNLEVGKIQKDGKLVEATDNDINKLLPELKTVRDRMLKDKEYKDRLIEERGYDEARLEEADFNRIHPVTGQEIPILGDEDEARDIAENTAIEDIEEAFTDSFLEWKYYAKAAYNNMERIENERNPIRSFITDLIDTDKNSWDNDKRQLKRLMESDSIEDLSGDGQDLEYLTYLPADTRIGKEYNDALDKFITYGRALKLNINPTKESQESYGNELWKDLQDGLMGEDFKTTQSVDKGVEVFENFYTSKGYELPEYEDDGWDSRGNWWRARADGASDGASGLAPILVSIAGFNKATGFKNLMKQAPKIAKHVSGGSKALRFGTQVGLMGTLTTAEWAAAEYAGQKILGSDHGEAWKAHTLHFDKEKGKWETNFTFPFAMGAAGTLWGGISKGVSNTIMKSRYGGGFALANNYIPETVKVAGKKLAGEPLTATSLLTFASHAEYAQKNIAAGRWPFPNIDENSEEGKALKEEYDAINPFTEVGFNSFVDTYLLMTGVGLSKFRGNAKEFVKAAEVDLLAMKNTTPMRQKAAKDLGANNKRRNKNGSFSESYIKSRVEKKSKSINKEIDKLENENKKLLDKRKGRTESSRENIAEKLGENQTKLTELQDQIKKIKQDGKILSGERNFLIAKAKAKNRKQYGEWLKQRYLDNNLFNKLRSGDLTAKEREAIGELTPEALQLIYDKAGIKHGSPEAEYYEWVVKGTTQMVENLNRSHVLKGSTARDTYIKNTFETIQNNWQIEKLQQNSKSNPDKKVENNTRIKEIKSKNKALYEAVQADMKKFNADFKKLMDTELANSRIQAKKLGFNFNVLGTKRYNKALIEAGKFKEGRGSEGFVIGNNIYINRKRALETRNLGVGMHEVVHALLKNSLKGKDGKISKDGIKVIDHMLSKLSEKERGIIQERIDKEYKFDENGKEKNKNEYYEEYITVLGDAIKNKLIERNYGTGRRLSRIFYPIIKKVFPNIYKFDINQTKGKKAVKDLFDMIQEIQSEGLTKEVLEAVKQGDGKATFATSRGMMETLDHFNSKKKGGEIEFGLDGRAIRKFKNHAEYKASPDGFWKAHEILSLEPRMTEDANVRKAMVHLENIIMSGPRKNPNAVKNYVENTPGVERDSFIREVKNNLEKRFYNNYDYDINPSLFGWLYTKSPAGKTILEHARGDAGMATTKRKVPTVSYDVKMAGGEKTFAETFADKTDAYGKIDSEQILGGSIHSKATTNLRKRMGITSDNPLFNLTKESLAEVYKSELLPDISDTKFRGAIEEALIKKLRKPVQDFMGKGMGPEYQQFLLNGDRFKGIFDSMTANELQSFDKQAESKGGRRLLTELDYKTGDTGLIKSLIKSGELPATAIDKAAQGVNVYKKKPLKFEKNGTMGKELRADVEAMFIKPNTSTIVDRLGYNSPLSKNTPTTRKEGLAKAIVSRFAKDATPEVLKRMQEKGELPDFTDPHEALHQQQLGDAVAIIHRQMNAIPIEAGGAMFSISEPRKDFSHSKVLDALLKQRIKSSKDLTKFLKEDGIVDLMYENPDLYDIIERHAEAIYGPMEFKNQGFISKTKELVPDIFNTLPEKFWQFRSVSSKGKDKVITYNEPMMRKQTELYTKKLLNFMPPEAAAREKNLIQTHQILKNSLFKLQSNRSPNGNGTLASRKQIDKDYGNLIKNMGSEMTPHTKKLWEDALKNDVIKHLDLAESTVQTQGSVNRAIQDIQKNFHKLSRAEKIGAMTTAFNPKSINASKKYLKAYMSSIQDWVNKMESSNTMTREQAMQHVFTDFYTNSNFTKGTRMLAPVTIGYIGKTQGKKKGEHMKDRSNVDAEMIQSIYKGTLLRDFNGIIEGFEQAIGPKEVFDRLDKLGGANNPNKNYRFLLDPKIAKDMIDLATGKDMYTMLTERHAVDLVKEQLKSYDNFKAVTNSMQGKKNLINFSKSGESRGMSTFDFDETVGVSENFVFAKKDGKTKKIASSEWPNVGEKLAKEGWEFDFTDFNKVTKGKPGPLLEKMKNQIKKYGPDNVFILTARAPQSQKAIHDWLKSEGVNIPIKNITGLGNSTGQAKAQWMLEKFAEGYNDMYFVDDALSNVKAVREVLDQLDIKSKVVQAKTKVKFGPWLVDVTTKEGRDFIKEYNKIETVSSSDPQLRAELANKKIQFSKNAKKASDVFMDNMKKWREGKGKTFYEEMNKIPTVRSSEFRRVGGLKIDLRTKEGRKISREWDAIKTVSSSEFKKMGNWIIDTRTEDGRKFVRDFESIPTVSSSEFGPGHYEVNGKLYKGKYPNGKLVDPNGGIKFSKSINTEFNEILERKSKGKFKAGKDVDMATARIIGKRKGKLDFFIPPSAEDFKGLMYDFLGKGEQGNADMRFFKKNLFDPFAKGIRDLTAVKQNMVEEYGSLKKKAKKVKLDKSIEGTPYTVDSAVRMYLWDKAGYEVPGIDKAGKRKLLDYVNNRPDLVSFAETLGSISRVKEGYEKPSEYWMVESIGSDLNNITSNRARKDFLSEWIENKNIIFSEANLNKIEAIRGSGYREALENMLTRMELGTNRLHGIKDGPTKRFYDWINGSVGATMFWNTRSAVLQTISMVNFTNFADNNVFAQAKVFANQPQFWKDFAFIMNSPMLKQRRAGLEIDVSASELTNVFKKSGNDPRSILKYFLEKGFTPTRIADSFAIAMGGAGFYRNRLNKYIKEGMSKAKAKEKTWLDFQELAEETQQSSRPDLISQQQAGPLGRLILAWQNTPMQMTRLMKKSLSDIVNRRKIKDQTQFQSDVSNLSRVLYYGAMQNLWFGTLQSGLAWLMFGSDMEDKLQKKEQQVVNGAFDTLLRGTGVYGAAVATLKNTILRYKAEKDRGWKKDLGNVAIEGINLSPPIGSKVRKVYSALKTWEYNKGVGKEIGWRIENPNVQATANIIEATVNVPLARIVNKANNLEEAITGNHETWQKTAMMLGWNRWNVEAKDEELEKARDAARQTRKEDKKKQKEEDLKTGKIVRCSGVKSNGKRCSLTTNTGEKGWKCVHHSSFKDGMDRDGDGMKEYQCKATTSSGKRCRNKTENKNKRCYAHQ